MCISRQTSVIVKIEFTHQITYEAPPRQNIFKGELATEKSVDKKKCFAILWIRDYLRCIQTVFKMKMIKMTTNRLRRIIIRWTFGSSVSNLIIRYFFFKRFAQTWLYYIFSFRVFFMIVSQIETFVLLRWSKECLSQEFQKPWSRTDHGS